MLARCAGPRREAALDLIFGEQQHWAFGEAPLDALTTLMGRLGQTRETVEACLNNKTLYDSLSAARDEAAKRFGVDATPTFFINDHKFVGDQKPEIMVQVIESMLKA